jgi:hypothetical protein
MNNNSEMARKYGSLLPQQQQLLLTVYREIHNSRTVHSLAAPPASGKTHVIKLLCKYFKSNSFSVCVVIPNNFLRAEYSDLPDIPVLTINQYLGTGTQFDYVLIDEAHNLKSSLELTPSLVKTVFVDSSSDIYAYLESRLLPIGQNYVAKQLSYVTSRDLLRLFRGHQPLREILRDVLRNSTTWQCFVYGRLGLFEIKFAPADYICRIQKARRAMLLFSASPLSGHEISFYCGIPENEIGQSRRMMQPTWKSHVMHFSVIDQLDPKGKFRLLSKILGKLECRTLVLFNNSFTCQAALKSLPKSYSKRIFHIASTERAKIYADYLARKNGKLLTASSAFWEGVTIPDLRLLIIPDPPYPRPTLLELREGRKVSLRLDVARRLVQGIGRIGRTSTSSGACVTFFSISEFVGSMPEKHVTALNSSKLVHELQRALNENLRRAP